MTSQARRLVALGLGALLISVPGLACGGSSASPTKVDAYDFGFKAQTITVKPGTSVTWTNTGQTIHTVKGSGFFSNAINPGHTYSFRFTKAGTFQYICTLHPTLMRGTVIVKQ